MSCRGWKGSFPWGRKSRAMRHTEDSYGTFFLIFWEKTLATREPRAYFELRFGGGGDTPCGTSRIATAVQPIEKLTPWGASRYRESIRGECKMAPGSFKCPKCER